jgi:hypothetical protein
MPATRKCLLCESPERAAIDRMLARKADARTINTFLEAHDLEPVHRNTISRHRQHVVALQKANVLRAVARAAAVVPPRERNDDFLEAVRDATWSDLEAGEIKPSLSEGLRAQEALDRRGERSADRTLLLRVSAVLSGAVGREAIEGPAEDDPFADEAAQDEAEFRRLTAGD